MDKIVYNKLVRDRVVENIHAQGESCEYEVLDDDASYERVLKQKIKEEATELANTVNKESFLEEYADLMVVLDTLTALYELSPAEIELALRINIEKKGYFKKRYFLKTADAKET